MYFSLILLDVVIGSDEEPLAHRALLLYARVHVIVNVDGGILLFLEAHVMNLDLAGLAEAQHTARGLVHKSCRPPRRGKDDTVHMLKVEASSSTLDLCENDRVARADKVLDDSTAVQGQKLRRGKCRLESCIDEKTLILKCCCLHAVGFRCRDDCVTLLGRQSAVIGVDVGNTVLLLEALLKKGNLILEIAEDDVAVAALVCVEDIDNLGGFCAVAHKVRTTVGLVGALLGVDVDLGVDADLAEAHQEQENHNHIRVVLLHKAVELCANDALDAAVEGRLLLRLEGEAVLKDLCGLGNADAERPQLRGSARDCIVGHPSFCRRLTRNQLGIDRALEERNKRSKVQIVIDDRSSSEAPEGIDTQATQLEILLALGVAKSVRLIADDAVVVIGEGVGRVQELVVVGDVDLAVLRVAADEHPGILLQFVDGGGHRVAGGELDDPLLQNSKGAEDEGLLDGGVEHKANGGESLAKTHLIADKAARCRRVLLALHHPPDGGRLVLVKDLTANGRHCKFHFELWFI